ncbi:TPA: signal peptidase I, partial [Clostridium perfringens]|nr:signal peptidase I [Clostridium perfringens]
MKCFNYILDLPDSFFKIIITILISLILILGFLLNNIFIAVVDGSSMEDTIHHGDVLIINKKSYSTTSPKRYDIVNIYAHYKYDNFLVKRIIGLPGDTIEINNSEVYINGDKI